MPFLEKVRVLVKLGPTFSSGCIQGELGGCSLALF